jgi:hypothetical protein
VSKGKPPKFDPDIYIKISLNDLIVYSVHYLHNQAGEITSEDIISACFELFPRRFSLRKYPNWPDSAVVSRRWSDCKSRGYIVGSTAKGFKLTAKGFRYAEKVGKSLGRERPVRRMPTEIKTRAGRFVRSIERSDAFIHYQENGRGSKINEFDFRSMLLCTMESSPATLERNLEQFREYVGVYHRKDLLTFLDICEKRFSHLLGASKKHPDRKMRTKKRKL